MKTLLVDVLAVQVLYTMIVNKVDTRWGKIAWCYRTMEVTPMDNQRKFVTNKEALEFSEQEKGWMCEKMKDHRGSSGWKEATKRT